MGSTYSYLIRAFILPLLLISGYWANSQSPTQIALSGTIQFQNFVVGGTGDVTGDLKNFNDQTNQFFATDILPGDVAWDNLGNRFEVVQVNMASLFEANVDLVNINNPGSSFTPFSSGYIGRETTNIGLSPTAPANAIGISPQLQARVQTHNNEVLDQFIGLLGGGGTGLADTITTSVPVEPLDFIYISKADLKWRIASNESDTTLAWAMVIDTIDQNTAITRTIGKVYFNENHSFDLAYNYVLGPSGKAIREDSLTLDARDQWVFSVTDSNTIELVKTLTIGPVDIGSGGVLARDTLIQDSILVYLENGIEVGRDTIRTGTTVIIGGATEFTQLDDTPGDYSGQAGQAVRVNDAEDGLEFVDGLDLINIDFGRIWYIAENGDDLTGEVGNPTRPFETVYSVRDSVIAGDIVLVNPGNYVVTTCPGAICNFVVDQVVYIFRPGAIFDGTPQSQFANMILADTNEVIKILGEGTFKLNRTPVTTRLNSQLTWHGDLLQSGGLVISSIGYQEIDINFIRIALDNGPFTLLQGSDSDGLFNITARNVTHTRSNTFPQGFIHIINQTGATVNGFNGVLNYNSNYHNANQSLLSFDATSDTLRVNGRINFNINTLNSPSLFATQNGGRTFGISFYNGPNRPPKLTNTKILFNIGSVISNGPIMGAAHSVLAPNTFRPPILQNSQIIFKIDNCTITGDRIYEFDNDITADSESFISLDGYFETNASNGINITSTVSDDILKFSGTYKSENAVFVTSSDIEIKDAKLIVNTSGDPLQSGNSSLITVQNVSSNRPSTYNFSISDFPIQGGWRLGRKFNIYTSDPGTLVLRGGETIILSANTTGWTQVFNPSNLNPGDAFFIKVLNTGGSTLTLDSTTGEFYYDSSTTAATVDFLGARQDLNCFWDGTNILILE